MEYTDKYRKNKILIVVVFGIILVMTSFLINLILTAYGEGSDEILCNSKTIT